MNSKVMFLLISHAYYWYYNRDTIKVNYVVSTNALILRSFCQSTYASSSSSNSSVRAA